MQQSVFLRTCAVILVVATISGCGGSKSSTTTLGKPAKVIVTPATLSLQTGEVAQLRATVQDAKGSVINTVTPTWTSDNTAVVQVSKTGLICAGTWDANFITCTPGPVGTANITASASGITSDKSVISVHQRIANLTLSAPAVACVSQAKTQQLTAVAKDASGNDITATVGTITYSPVNPNIATPDSTGLVTAKQPGQTQIIATVSNITSLPVTFTTCPPATIILGTQGTTPLETSFTLAPGAAKTLSATITDTLGNPITDIVLTFSSYYPNVVSATGTTTTATVTGTNAGTTAVVASCTPPSCNSGVNQSVYSNVVVATVSGTTASTAYVTGKGATTIVPIDTGTNVAGTAITVPSATVSSVTSTLAINSFVFARNGLRAFLGADTALLVLDPTTNSFSADITNIQGKVLAVSPNGNKAIVSDVANSKVYVYDSAANGFETFTIANAIAADWTPDNFKAFIVSSGSAGNSLYVYSPVLTLRNVALGGAANDVTALSQGSIAYVAGGSAPLTTFTTCDNAQLGTVAASTTPLLLRTTTDATHVLGLTGGSIIDDLLAVETQPCPPTTVSNAVTEHSFGVSFAPNKFIVDSAGTHAYATSNTTGVLAYDVAAGTTSVIALGAGATGATTADLTLDGKQLYVGELGTNDVHVIDTPPTNLDVKQIAVGLKKTDNTVVSPDFVVVRPK